MDGGDVCCDHWFAQDGQVRYIVFWADTAVAEGLLVRRWEEEEGAYRYWTKESALELRSSTEKKLLQ